MLADLVLVRVRGFAINNQESEAGLISVAAPIRGRRGEVLAAINMTFGARSTVLKRITQEMVPLLTKTADEISLKLGYCLTWDLCSGK